MPELTENQLNEIAENLECSFRCYWNHKTWELLALADREDPMYDGDETWEADYKRVDEQPEDFIEITKPSSGSAFRIMKDFAHSLKNQGLKRRLLEALDERKPFNKFREIIDDMGDYRDDWFAFRRLKFKEHVQDQIDMALRKEIEFEEEEE